MTSTRRRSLNEGFQAGVTAPAREPRPTPTPSARPPSVPVTVPATDRVQSGTYRDFVKRDTKIWPDQEARLKQLEADIRNDLRSRGVTPPRRITINTLVRVALESFLDDADSGDVRGTSETELLASLRATRKP